MYSWPMVRPAQGKPPVQDAQADICCGRKKSNDRRANQSSFSSIEEEIGIEPSLDDDEKTC
jgi:hypothetical protein